MSIFDDLVQKKKRVAVIGLGYVGLPLALQFASRVSVIGYDIDGKRISALQNGHDATKEVAAESFSGKDIVFTADPHGLKEASFFIVAVPTPVDAQKVPYLAPLLLASETIGQVITPGSYVVFESTVYPGCTEEDCLPLIEEISGLQCGPDFKLGYSPERINPGDRAHSISNTVKIVSASDGEALDEIARVYGLIVEAGIYKAPGIKVAEAGKILENTQRYLNISLMNELSLICDRLGINTHDVIDAAATKWNFMRFTPGLVGGHCIGVDPYYLKHKAQQLGYQSNVLASGERINDEMPYHIAKKALQHIVRNGVHPADARVLVLGTTFKENVSDIRNSKVFDMVKDLMDYSVQVHILDPYADPEEVRHQHGLHLQEEAGSGYDVVILAVAHDQFRDLSEEGLLRICKPTVLFADLKGHYRNRFTRLAYWNL